ncbi:MAG: hypothetical protein AAF531_15570 [Actinomycetota bacterium]
MSQQLLDVLKQQRRRRRLGFWVGFLAILLVGGLWAQLSKDPLNAPFAGEFQDFPAEPAVVEAELILEDVPTTTIPPPTTVSPTTIPLTAPPSTTVAEP